MELPEWLRIAASVGTALSGMAAMLAVVLGALGFRAWRLQKRRELESSAAIRVFELLARAVDGLQFLASPVVIGRAGTPSENKATAQRLRDLLDERTARATPQLRALDEAASATSLLLGGRHELFVDGLRAVRRTIQINYHLCALHIGDGEFEKASQVALEAWGPEVRERIERIRGEARDSLKPVAQYHSSPLLSTILAAQRRRLREWGARRRAKARERARSEAKSDR